MSFNAGAAGRPSATYDIARDLGNLVYRQQPAFSSMNNENAGAAASPVAFPEFSPRIATGGAEL